MYNCIRVARATRITRPFDPPGHLQVQGCLRGLCSAGTVPRHGCASQGPERRRDSSLSTLLAYLRIRAPMPRQDTYIVSKVRGVHCLAAYTRRTMRRASAKARPRRNPSARCSRDFSAIRALYWQRTTRVPSSLPVVKFKDVLGDWRIIVPVNTRAVREHGSLLPFQRPSWLKFNATR